MIGDGTAGTVTSAKLTPTLINIGTFAGQFVDQFACGETNSVLLTSNKQIYTWGKNSNGMIGDGTTTSRSTPTLISIPGVTPASVYMSLSISAVLTTTGRLILWGENSQGQMGQGTITSNVNQPTEVRMGGLLNGKTITKVALSDYFVHVVTSDNTVGAWGLNSHGQLGTCNSAVPIVTLPVATLMKDELLGKTIDQIHSGHEHTIALSADGNMYGWGRNVYIGFYHDRHNKYKPFCQMVI